MKKYNYLEGSDDFDALAKTFVEDATRRNIPIEPSDTKAKHMIKNDLRDAIPPQLYALIGQITSAIELAGEKSNSEKERSHK